MKRHPNPPEPAVSLGRALSKLGVCSRSQAKRLINTGRVSVNGVVQRNPARRVDLDHDQFALDGRPITAAAPIYLMLNKPRGLVTTRADERDRATVYRCLDDPSLPWLSPVGRLDKASEGLLLFSNDTRWAAGILDPTTHLEKTYHVQVNRPVEPPVLHRLVAGLTDRDEWLQATRADLLRSGGRTCWLEIGLDQGLNRQIRRMLAHFDLEVLRLVRVAIGPLALGDLPKGAYRHLTPAERDSLASRSEKR